MSVRAAAGPTVMLATVGLVVLVTSAQPSPPPATPHPGLLALSQDYWRWKLHNHPQFATHVGLNDDTARHLTSLDMDHLQRMKAKCEEFLQRANQIDAASLSPQDSVTLKVFKDEMTTFIENFPYMEYFAPVTYLTGPQVDFKKTVVKEMVLASYSDYQKLLSRYGELPRQTQEILALLRGNIENNIMPSNWSMVGVVDQLDSLDGPVEDSVFYKPFLHMPSAITTEQRTTLRQQAQERIKQDLLPSFRNIRDFLVNQYLPVTRPEVGASSLPGGKDYYQACLKYFTSTNLTPQEIHDLGLKEVARVEEEVQETAAEIGMAGKTFPEISHALKADPAQGFSSKEDLLQTMRHTVYNDIFPRVLEMFPDLPPGNLTVVGDDSPQGIFAQYSAPSLDGSRLGSFIINTYSYESWMKYEVMALSLHEALPGHHLYTLHRKMNPLAPDFRKYVDFTFLTSSPSKFPVNMVYSEGWSLYSEFLGEELGLYTDAYKKMGRHSYELLRSSRLVVDTGMHAFGWSRERAVAYLLSHTAMSEQNIQGEVNRYITWPGQACAYKIGEIKIREMRQRAEDALGPRFLLSDFHNVLLGCMGPLHVAEECVTDYIHRANLVKEKGGEDEKKEEKAGRRNKEGNGAACTVLSSVVVLVVCWLLPRMSPCFE